MSENIPVCNEYLDNNLYYAATDLDYNGYYCVEYAHVEKEFTGYSKDYNSLSI